MSRVRGGDGCHSGDLPHPSCVRVTDPRPRPASQTLAMAGIGIALGVVSIVAVGICAGVVAFVARQLRATTGRRLADRELRETGSRALATVISVRCTDRVRNHLNVQCEFEFLVCPADGSTPFPLERELIVPLDSVPRPGDTWPAWFLPADRTQVLVAAPAARPVVTARGVERTVVDGRDDQHSAA